MSEAATGEILQDSGELYISWDDADALVVAVSNQIEEYLEQGNPISRVVVVSRGGDTPGDLIARRIGVGTPNILFACMGSYDPEEEMVQTGEFLFGQMPPDEMIVDQDILLADEVCDSGRSFKVLIEWLLNHGAKSVKTAVLHYKPDATDTGIVPDFYAALAYGWVHYPWERHDDYGKKAAKARRARLAARLLQLAQ